MCTFFLLKTQFNAEKLKKTVVACRTNEQAIDVQIMDGQINYCLLSVYSRYFSLSDGENGLYIFGLATLALLPTFFYRPAHVHFFIVFFPTP